MAVWPGTVTMWPGTVTMWPVTGQVWQVRPVTGQVWQVWPVTATSGRMASYSTKCVCEASTVAVRPVQ